MVFDDSAHGFFNLAGAELARHERHFAAVKVVRARGEQFGATPSRRGHGASYRHRGLPPRGSRPRRRCSGTLGAIGASPRIVRSPHPAARRGPGQEVSGFVPSWPRRCLVLSKVAGGTVVHAEQPPALAGPWDLTGTGCLMVFRPLAKAVFRPIWHVPGTPRMVQPTELGLHELREAGQPVLGRPRRHVPPLPERDGMGLRTPILQQREHSRPTVHAQRGPRLPSEGGPPSRSARNGPISTVELRPLQRTLGTMRHPQWLLHMRRSTACAVPRTTPPESSPKGSPVLERDGGGRRRTRRRRLTGRRRRTRRRRDRRADRRRLAVLAARVARGNARPAGVA